MAGDKMIEKYSEDSLKISLLDLHSLFLNVFKLFTEECFLYWFLGLFARWVCTVKPLQSVMMGGDRIEQTGDQM